MNQRLSYSDAAHAVYKAMLALQASTRIAWLYKFRKGEHQCTHG